MLEFAQLLYLQRYEKKTPDENIAHCYRTQPEDFRLQSEKYYFFYIN